VLGEVFRRTVLAFLSHSYAIYENLCSKLLGWRHRGFSAHTIV